MHAVAGHASPVVIENVNLIINVYNIGNGEFGLGSTVGFPPPQTSATKKIISSCVVKSANFGDNVGGCPGAILEGALPETSSILQEPIHKSISEVSLKSELVPLGWLAYSNGNAIPFGLQPIPTEIPKFGDKKTWKEIRVCLPSSLLADNETELHCPVSSCRAKLPKNKSIDCHIKKHLGIINDRRSAGTTTNDNGGNLPCPLSYYCYEKSCQYNVETAEKSFKAYKNLKQHYMKVHAPKLFVCDLCQKTFSTLKTAETHKLMCGEKYSCSTCGSSYNSLEALQTHCRRKTHVYDHMRYKDKRNVIRQEIQSQTLKVGQLPTIPNMILPTTNKKAKQCKKLPHILPKGLTNSNEVFQSIQTFCQQAGVKVDYGCQTVCTAFLQKGDLVEGVVSEPGTLVLSETGGSFTQKKRKSTDTQTNIVKFRATCLDQRHNATNTNVDWKTVVTSDSQTQTADTFCGLVESCSTDIPESIQLKEEFPRIKPSEAATSVALLSLDEIKKENSEENIPNVDKVDCIIPAESSAEKLKNDDQAKATETPASKQGYNGPSLHPEFISFLEATDSATQTDPDMFIDKLGSFSNGLDMNLENIDSGNEANIAYVSVSSTASQTAVENVSSKSLSAEDYEALLNATAEEDLNGLESFNEYLSTTVDNVKGPLTPKYATSDMTFDWENLVEEVYWDLEEEPKKPTVVKNSQK